LFRQRENELGGLNELDNGLGVSLEFSVLVHLIPRDNLVGLLQGGVDEAGDGGLQVSDLFRDEAGHEHQVELRRVKHIKGVLSHD